MTTPTGAEAARILDPLPIGVSKPLVLLRLGYRRPDQVPAKTAAMIDDVVEKGTAMLAPKAIWTDVAASEEPEAVLVAGVIRSGSRSLRERLGGCRVAVLFAATIGSGLEAW